MRSVGRINAAENDGIYLSITSQSGRCRTLGKGDGITDSGISDVLYRGGKIANLTCVKGIARLHSGRLLSTDLDHVKFGAGCHHFDGVAGMYDAALYSEIYDNPFIRVVVGVENERLQGCFAVADGCRNVADDIFHYVADV